MNKAVWFFLFFLFLLEGSVLQLVLPQAWGSHFVVVPLLVLSGIISISMHMETNRVLWTAFSFGLLHDIVYGPAIGISTFSMVLIAWGTAWISRHFSPESWMGLGVVATMQLGYLFLIYGWYQLFDFTRVPLMEAIQFHMLPSLGFNFLFATLIVYVFRKMLIKEIRRKVPDFD